MPRQFVKFPDAISKMPLRAQVMVFAQAAERAALEIYVTLLVRGTVVSGLINTQEYYSELAHGMQIYLEEFYDAPYTVPSFEVAIPKDMAEEELSVYLHHAHIHLPTGETIEMEWFQVRLDSIDGFSPAASWLEPTLEEGSDQE